MWLIKEEGLERVILQTRMVSLPQNQTVAPSCNDPDTAVLAAGIEGCDAKAIHD